MTPRLSTARLLARSRIWIFILGAAACQQPPAGTSGTDAGATIEVWKAWLTGSGIAVCPRSCRIATACPTASVAPPITTCEVELTFAITA